MRLTEKWGFNISKRWGETYRDKSLATNTFLGRSLLQSAKKNNGILLKTTGFRLEYIYLNSNTTPADQLNRYDESAWLLVVQGNILIQIEGEENFYDLNVGDNLLITRHHHYHIIQTDLAPETICLGLFWSLHD
uniref:Cupin 2 conserved barrel domain-containing protein n=1 Tax=Paulinella longichromatophora TaxID=1708747 RepID=A0A2H4ZNB9_9EUKA|nr:hypothetical protein PLO_009 [Paulinella longichromatophora]